MTLHIRSTVILFDLALQRIRNDTDQLASRARVLMQGKKYPDNYDHIDLRASERSLREAADKIRAIREEIEARDAADKLDAIRDRLGMPELELAAAE